MTIMSRLLARLYKLPPAETYDIAVDKGLEVPMPDGVVVRADRYYPRDKRNLPTVLTPRRTSVVRPMPRWVVARAHRTIEN